MKKILLLSCLCMVQNGFAAELHNFFEVKSAITEGKPIHIAIDFTKCETSQKNTPLTHIAVFTPDNLQVFDSRILTSFMHFTMNNITYPNTPLYEFVHYAITDDNNLNLSYQALDAKNYSTLINKITFNCKMNVGFKVYD